MGLGRATHKGKVARVQADLKAFEGALLAYESENGSLPPSDQGLKVLIEGGYLNKRDVPKDPWKHEYVYVVPGPSNLPFDIVSYGADGQEGGEEKNQDIKLSEIE
ncbi:MAG: type II secretion system protein GspG [Deltaproteobacteria bacterium]|nr:type II secretion system protein GspG [Deltaproteobacteria bacterium]